MKTIPTIPSFILTECQGLLYRPGSIRRLLGSFPICLVVSCVFVALSSPLAALDDAVQRGAVSSSLEGHQWRISQFYVSNSSWLSTLPLRVPIPSLAFRDGKIEGSAGCGQFTGTYRGTDDQLAISASWADDTKSPCSDEQKEEAANILHALVSARRIRPVYDALLLQDENEVLQVRLAAMQSGKDLSELHDTFWHLNQLEGSTINFPQPVINIGEGNSSGITFSTSSYLIGFPFQYHLLTGLDFAAAYEKGGDSKSSNYSQDQQVANVFEGILHKVVSYELKKDELTFFDKDQHPTMVLSAFRPTGIEDRKWRISKYRADNSGQPDEDGLNDAKVGAWIVFSNGRVDGSPGCGGWTGTYKVSGDELTFQAGWLIAGLCPSEDMDNDSLVQKAFESGIRIEQSSDHILLRDKSGQAQILLVPF
jgi:heat shock protein HslJ